ncbi:asparaginase [Paenibacillus gorillae]|uniref:asparaginase n=1 Tax=Paenibacillus gorillae TaxID=1243662 RepID=UPI0005AA2C1E|nr:asparaginase [Paenibacillus gorillae]
MSGTGKIAVLFTGGTIGSKNNNGTVSVHESGTYALLEAYGSLPDKRDVQFETAQPLNVLSENLVPEDWNTLMDALDRLDKAEYAGIIVTHGSDTLAYSAAMLSYLCCDSPVPIVLVAANYHLGDERSNGVSNFAAAIDFIMDTGSAPGVFVVYRNDRGESLVYLGTRITQCESFTDQFGSPYTLPYGRVEQGCFIPETHSDNPTLTALRARERTVSPWAERGSGKRIESGLLYIKPFTGIDYSFYDFSRRKPKAVLHDLYHSGTASANAPGNYSLLGFAEYCGEQGVDLYLCPLKDRTEAMYASSVSLMEAGVVFIDNLSVEAALMKLMLAYSLFDRKEDIESFMWNTELFYERLKRDRQGADEK